MVLSLLYGPILTSIHDYWKNYSFDSRDFIGKVMSLLFNTLSWFVIAFLLRSKSFLISWLQSPSAVIGAPKNSLSQSITDLHLRRPSYLSLLFSETLHSDECIFPFLPCLLVFFFPPLFVKLPQTTILPSCGSFSLGGFGHCLLYNVMNLHP